MNDILNNLSTFNHVVKSIEKNNTPILATGVIDVSQIHLAHSISKQLKRPYVFITSSDLKAQKIYNDIKFFDENVVYYKSKDILFYSADVYSNDLIKTRFEIINSILNKESQPIVLSIEGLFDRLIKKDLFVEFILNLKIGDVFNLEELSKKLIYMGYERAEAVESIGQFAIRGCILDIFTPTVKDPIRVEFWDDEIDSIRIIDALSQRSIENAENVSIFPTKELLYTEETLITSTSKIELEYEKCKKKFEENGEQENLDCLNDYIGEALNKFKEEKVFQGISSYVNYFYDDTVTFLDYLDKDTLIFLDEPHHIKSSGETVEQQFLESLLSRIEKGYLLPSQIKMLFSYSEILKSLNNFSTILFTTITTKVDDFKLKDIANFKIRSTASFNQRFDLFCEEIVYLKENSYSTLILGGSKTKCQRLVSEFYEKNIEVVFLEDLNNFKLTNGVIFIAEGKLSHGFLYDDLKFALFSDKELFGEGVKKKKKKKKKSGSKISTFAELTIGDYVVHDTHGIGIFKGLEQIVVENISKDYLKIIYSDSGSLFVPVNQMDMIQKFIGNDAITPKLNKLGGQEWSKSKAKVRKSVQVLAEDLIKLYAKREATKGYIYSEDNLWQREFEEMFPYDETDDQLDAIADVKRDMESDKVMDRLVCGDVGFGKTEVAIRAAFKAVQDGKQVAYLVPTTILATQHFNTFVERMMDYPINVGLLSRFVTGKQQKEVLDKLKNGQLDIVVGTHRLLSKDMKFKDLGMVIVDEEQRFGVAHKEKLKTLTENVDVLTLTATPIPRTLHMSLAGIRDMSVLEEAPNERMPIQTYVLENNPEFIKNAINREVGRGGQVYYLYNRVSNIEEIANKVSKLVPDAVVDFAHGQMSERQLESVMKSFIEGEIDVLVCTTIIETGLDISNVNTIIIQDADKMGLSQLYQLRGRVGRSNKSSYAYLCYQRDKVLLEVAEKRLQTIKEFTEFGSGFKIAMRDLEFRGAGNLLGGEQHGHMETVGYDMYCKILNEAIQTLKGEEVKTQFETSININLNAYIPDYYIKNEVQRLEIYKKISQISTENDYFDVQDEIEDRFSTMPKYVSILLEVALIKALANSIGIISVTQKLKSIILLFKKDANLNPVAITTFVKNNSNKCSFTGGNEPYLTLKINEKEKLNFLDDIKTIINYIRDFEKIDA